MSKNVLPALLRKHWSYFLFLSGGLLIACLFASPSQAKERAAYRPFTLNRSMVLDLTHTLTQTNTIYMPLAANDSPTTVPQPTIATTPTVATTPIGTIAPTVTPTRAAPTLTATTTRAATPTDAATPGGAATPGIPGWKLETFYPAGTLVTYRGGIYKCLQAHTSTLGWEPPLVVTLWQRVGTDPNTITPTATATASGMATATSQATTVAPTATAQAPSATPQATTAAPTATPPSQPATPIPPGANGWPSRLFAPYVDVTLSSPGSATGIGQKFYTLAFIVAANFNCRASSLGPGDIVSSLRAQGGNAIPAFGGASGLELAQACKTVEELQAQYQAVIDTYGFDYLDFDIEGAAIAEPASITRRNQAIANLQAAAAKAGKSLRISYTLPVLTSGLTLDGVNLLSNAIANGVDISIVNIMTMDYGASAPPYTMGKNAIDAANSLFAQLQKLYPTKTDAQLWGMIGITPMIGLNDTAPSVFTLDDAKLVIEFAQKKQIGLLSMWSIGRDKQCTGNPGVSPTCSGVTQAPLDFTKIFMPFTQ